MNCERANELLVDYLYHELDETEVRPFEAHLAACAECARRLSSVRATLEVVHGLPQLEPSMQVTSSLTRAAADALPQEPSILERFLSSMRFLVVHPAMTAAVTLVVVVGISFFAYQRTAPPGARLEGPLPEVSYQPPSPTSATPTPAGTDPGALESSVGRLSTELKAKENDTTASIASTGARKQTVDEPARDEERPTTALLTKQEAEKQAPMDNRRHVGTRGLWSQGVGRAAKGYVGSNRGGTLADDNKAADVFKDGDPKVPRRRPRARRVRKPDAVLARPAPAPKASPSAKATSAKDRGTYFLKLAENAMTAGRCEEALKHYNRALSLNPGLSPVVAANVRRCAGVLGRGGEGELLKASKRFPMLARQLQGEIRRMRSDRAKAEPPQKAARKAKVKEKAPAAVDAYK